MARCRAPKPRVIENVGRGPVPRRAIRTRSSLCSLRSPDRKQVLSAPFYIERRAGACPSPCVWRADRITPVVQECLLLIRSGSGDPELQRWARWLLVFVLPQEGINTETEL